MAAIDDRETLTKTSSKPITGADVLVESLAPWRRCRLCLSRGGEHAAAPGGAHPVQGSDSHDLASPRTRGHLRRRGIRAARASRAWSWRRRARGARHLVTGLADAKMDSVPLVAVTGQVPRHVIGTDAFQETPMVEVSRAITKHHYLGQDKDIARIVREAFHLASTGRPGPVLIDMPKDVQNTVVANPVYDVAMDLPGYRLPPPLRTARLTKSSR